MHVVNPLMLHFLATNVALWQIRLKLSDFHSPARELMSTPPSQRNGLTFLSVGTPHSQGGSRGASPHMVRRGEQTTAASPVTYR